MDRSAFLGLLAAAGTASPPANEFAEADRLAAGGLGVVAFERGSARRWQLRPDRHFRMASVFKLPLAAYVWEQVDAGEIGRGSAIPIRKSDLRPGPGTTEADTSVPPLVLVGRMLRDSDNTAADVLLRTIGGPRPVNRWLARRSFDIHVNSTEADMARAPATVPHAGDLRDTATPAAMATFLDLLVHGDLVGAEATAETPADAKASLGPLAYAITAVRKWAENSTRHAAFASAGFDLDVD
ncbi:MAG: serine hydrolase, partial [Candidatus Velthaea sp.]